MRTHKKLSKFKMSYRWKRKLTNLVYPILILALTSAVFLNDKRIRDLERIEDLIHPYESFAQVEVAARVGWPGEEVDLSTTGSAIVVDIVDGNSIVLTANHVCNPPPVRSFLETDMKQFIEKVVIIHDFFGGEREGEIILNQENDDLCLVRVEGVWATPVPIAMEPLTLGEKAYNVAAPTGFFQPGMVPMFEGRYSGDVGDLIDWDSVYSFPTRRGSSGSVVINKNGEAIGIIHSAIGGLPSVGIACTWKELNSFMLTYQTMFRNNL